MSQRKSLCVLLPRRVADSDPMPHLLLRHLLIFHLLHLRPLQCAVVDRCVDGLDRVHTHEPNRVELAVNLARTPFAYERRRPQTGQKEIDP